MSALNPAALTDFNGALTGSAFRTTISRVPVVPNYVTSRLRPKRLMTAGSAFASCQVTLRNTGSATCILRLQVTDDPAPDAARTYVGTAITLVPKGEKTVTVSLDKAYVELKSIEGTSEVEWTIVGQVGFDAVPFDRMDTYYPRILWDDTPDALVAPAIHTQSSANTTWNVTHSLGFTAMITALDANGVDITSLATVSNATVNGYTLTFGSAKSGRAISNQ